MTRFISFLGVNTIRYCHRAGKQLECAQDLFNLLVPGGMCVVIDMNDRFPAFRSAVRKKLAGEKENEEECYIPSLKEYTEPFAQAGFEVLRSEHFCWIPHSGGAVAHRRFAFALADSKHPGWIARDAIARGCKETRRLTRERPV